MSDTEQHRQKEYKTKADLMNEIAEVVEGVEPREYEHSMYFSKGDLRAISEWIAEHQEVSR